jgi:hypothetical protein
MKGKLHKMGKEWVVRHPAYVPPHEYELPLHPYQDPNYEFGRDMDGEEVEFDVEEFWETGLEQVIKVALILDAPIEEEKYIVKVTEVELPKQVPLYTDEQVREIVKYTISEWASLNEQREYDHEKLVKTWLSIELQNFIQSLKQPKKD